MKLNTYLLKSTVITIFFLFLITPKVLGIKTFVEPQLGDRIVDLLQKVGDTLNQNRYSIGDVLTNVTSLTIDTPGNYIVGEDISSPITIASDNVYLNLNGYAVYDTTGTNTLITVESGFNDITIRNGSLAGDTTTLSPIGILIKKDTSLVTLENIRLTHFETAIYFDGQDAEEIKECNGQKITIYASTKGVVAHYLQKSIFESCDVKSSIEAGFELKNSDFNNVTKCTVLGLENDDPDKGAVGFSTSAGQGNLFYECVADGIISTTSSFKKNAIGFLFTGSGQNQETESKIINSIVNTVNVSGCGTGYGIFLEPIWLNNQLDSLFTFSKDISGFDVANSVAWSPDGKYLAYGGRFESAVGTNILVELFLFDGIQLIPLAEYTKDSGVGTTDIAYSVAWSPDGKYLVYGGRVNPSNTNIIVEVLSFNGTELISTSSYTKDVGTTDIADSVAWSPDGKYIAYGGRIKPNNTNIIVEVLRFDGTELISTSSYVKAAGGFDVAYSVAWSPDGKYIAYGGRIALGNIIVEVLRFDGTELVSIDSYTKNVGTDDVTYSVAWSPDGKYLVYAGEVGLAGEIDIIVEMLQFTGTDLIFTDSYIKDVGTDDIAYSVVWSPDGKYLAYGGRINPNGVNGIVEILSFNGSELIFTSSYTKNVGSHDIVYSVAWSPDGKYLAYGGYVNPDGNYNIIIELFNPLMSSPSQCKIENNNICNCQNSTVVAGGAIGLSASGGTNLLVKNICYENDISVSYGVFNTFFGGLNGSPNLFDNLSVPPYNVEFN